MASLDASDASTFSLESVVCGHHVYKRVWTPFIGEQLTLKHEDNANDWRAVSVIKIDAVVGHLPREVAKTVLFFLKRGDSGVCAITGRRKKGKGLELPCVYTFSGPNKLVKRLQSLLQEPCVQHSCPY